jgi:hypothetical protein
VRNFAKLSEPVQQQMLESEAEQAETQKTVFGNPPVSEFDSTSKAYDDASQRNATAAQSGDHFTRFTVLHEAGGKAGVYQLSNQNNNADIPITLADGTKTTIAKGSMDGGTYFGVQAGIAKNNADNDLRQQAQDLKKQLADKKEADAAAANVASGWVPKATADEKKKAELAENIAYNANEVNNILARRPDIVGAVAGRITNTKQMIGNDDPDISALGTEIHNISMANSGVHGMRSQQGVEEGERNILNNFKNGPNAVGGALKANVGSVQTFIDDARPDTYKTHSNQGGALGYYAKQQPGDAQGAAGKVHKNMADFKQATPTKEHGTLYTDDGQTWYAHDGSVYKGQ